MAHIILNRGYFLFDNGLELYLQLKNFSITTDICYYVTGEDFEKINSINFDKYTQFRLIRLNFSENDLKHFRLLKPLINQPEIVDNWLNRELAKYEDIYPHFLNFNKYTRDFKYE